VRAGVPLLVDDALSGHPEPFAEPVVADAGQRVELGHVRGTDLGHPALVVEQQRVVFVPALHQQGGAGVAAGLEPVVRGVGVGIGDQLLEADHPVAEPGGGVLPVGDGQLDGFLDVDHVVLR
jgi:hypothetical protein